MISLSISMIILFLKEKQLWEKVTKNPEEEKLLKALMV